MREVKILLAPNWETAKRIKAEATVEAEYGEHILKGTMVTLAHHVEEFRNNPAPCVQKVPVLPMGSKIVISHIDLDTLGGIMSLVGEKPVDKEFWRVVEFIDVNGPHHIIKFPKQKDKLNAYWSMKLPYPKKNSSKKVVDVTQIVKEHIEAIKKILKGDMQLIEQGKNWVKRMEKKVEDCLIEEDRYVRIFKTNGVFCSSSYYSKKQKAFIPATVVFNERDGEIKVSNHDRSFNADEVMKKLFGNESGGKAGIAGSPRGKRMSKKDFEKAVYEIRTLLSQQEEKYIKAV